MISNEAKWSPNDLPHPFNFYKVLLNSDMLHFGYWLPGKENFSLEEAQQAASELVLSQLPKAPARVLDIGCGLGATSQYLHKKGYEVVAISPDKAAVEYARDVHPGPRYIVCGFLDDNPVLKTAEKFDVILMQESLQYFPEIQPVFLKIIDFLKDDGRVLICDEVSYHQSTNQFSVVKQVDLIEREFHKLGFYVYFHKKIGKEVTPTCTETIHRFREKRQILFDTIDDSEQYLDHYIEGWKHQKKAYQMGTMGYEIWNLRHGKITIKNYQDGDESTVLKAFNKAFNVSRTHKHWFWKFKTNPFGGPFTSLAWDGNKLAAQYTGYPLLLDIGDNQEFKVFHNGDTFVLPEYRGVGVGRNNLLARTFRFWERTTQEGNVFIAYGFNTGKIRRLCQLFLGITVDLPIYEWNLPTSKIYKAGNIARFKNLISGFSVSKETTVGDWANQIYGDVRNNYPWLIKRNKEYLSWRYEQHPDFTYCFYLVKHWGNPVGWFITRPDGDKLYLVDALVSKNNAAAILRLYLQQVQKDYPEVEMISSWFSEIPEWWVKILKDEKFEKQRQFQDLYLGAKSYDDRVTTQVFADRFYFTMGDSDLF